MQKTLTALMMVCGLAVWPVWAAEEDSLQVLLTEIPAQYVQPIAPGEVAVYFLKGIDQLDKNLRVGDDRDKISLYYQGMLVKSLYKPQDANDVAGWVALSGEVLDLAVKKSPVARSHDFEAVDVMMKAAIANFDKDSKYYAGLEKNEERVVHRRNFADRMEGENLLLKIGAFNNFTKEDIVKAVGEHPEAKGIVLDLRGSPGGQLSAAVDVADLFLDEGIVVSTRGRDEAETTYYNSHDGDVTGGRPIAVLIDGDTASAAEVLAAALQEQSRAKIIGSKSFGKGTIQSLIKLPSGGTVSLSSAYFYTPSGHKLAGAGVNPDICTYAMPEGKDIEKLISAGKDPDCEAESRVNSVLENEIAAQVLKI